MKVLGLIVLGMSLLNFGSASVRASECCIPKESGLCDDGQPPVCPTPVAGDCDQAVQDYVSQNIYSKGEYSQDSTFAPFGALPPGFQVSGDFSVTPPEYYAEDGVRTGSYLVEFTFDTDEARGQYGLASICADLGGACHVLNQPIGVEPDHGGVSGTVACGQ